MRNVKTLAEMMLRLAESKRPERTTLEEAREKARCFVASTLLELGRGNQHDAQDLELAFAWADEVVEAISNYTMEKVFDKAAELSMVPTATT